MQSLNWLQKQLRSEWIDMKFLKSEKGEFTVEATIVFTISFMALIVIMYVGIVMYQHVHLQSVTDRIASRGAMMYATRTTNMENGYKSPSAFWDCDPYRYISDKGYKNTAEAEIEKALNAALGNGNVIASNTNDGADATVKLGMFSRKVEVIGNRSFNVPFVSIFDVDNSFFNLNVKSTAYIMDMPETIRNVDYAVDMIKQNETAQKAIGKVGELKEKLQTFISKIE